MRPYFASILIVFVVISLLTALGFDLRRKDGARLAWKDGVILGIAALMLSVGMTFMLQWFRAVDP